MKKKSKISIVQARDRKKNAKKTGVKQTFEPADIDYLWFLLKNERRKLKFRLKGLEKYEENYPTHRIDMRNEHKIGLENEINKLKYLIPKILLL